MGKMSSISLTPQGILFLVGIGVRLMPIEQSWTASIIIFAIAFIWLIATGIYWLRHRNKVERSMGLIGKSIVSVVDNELPTPLHKNNRLISPLLIIAIGLGLFIWGLIDASLSLGIVAISFGMAFLIWGISRLP